ncbi:MAG: hypothetical protein AB7T63_04290 [Planctomycetota bacterium]
MMRSFSWILMVLALALFAACGDKGDADKGGTTNGTGATADHDGDHDHDADHDHDGDHDHDDHDDHDHGERHVLGEAQAGGYTVALAVFGDIKAGGEAVLDINVSGGDASVVRAWVGVESGKGSMKGKVDGEDGDYHGHIEIPAEMAEGSAIWVEIEGADGAKNATSFKLP